MTLNLLNGENCQQGKVYECLMWFTFSKKLYVLVYKKLFVPQLHLSYALLFCISSYFIEETDATVLWCIWVS